MTGEVVILCAKVPAELARRFDEKAPNRSIVLRRLIEEFVDGAAVVPAVVDTGPVCSHPEVVQLATGAFCPQCRKKVADG